MVEVKSHKKRINGKDVLVKQYSRKEPLMNAKEYLEDIKKPKSIEEFYLDKTIPSKILGKGQWTKFIQKGDKYFIETTDVLKELYTPFWRNDYTYKHYPNLMYPLEIEKYDKNGMQIKIYEVSKLYDIKATEHKEAWKQYKEIKNYVDSENWNNAGEWGHIKLQNISDKVTNSETLPNQLKEEFADVTSNATNYGSSTNIEISPRNIKVDDKGNLVLNDIYYDKNRVISKR